MTNKEPVFQNVKRNHIGGSLGGSTAYFFNLIFLIKTNLLRIHGTNIRIKIKLFR